MGLFRKKKTASEDALQQELDALEERLAAADRTRTELEERLSALADVNATLAVRIATLDEANTRLDSRLGTLDQANARLDTRLDSLDHGFGLLGDQIGSLSATNERLGQRLGAVDDLDARLRELTDRLNTPVTAPPPSPAPPTIPPPSTVAPPPPPPPMVGSTVDDDRLDELSTRLELLATAVAAHTESLATTQARLAEIGELDELLEAARTDEGDTSEDDIVEIRRQLADVTERVNGMDTRVTSVSTELANQLTELSRDIDELNRRSQEAAAADDGEPGQGSVDIDTTEIETRLAERLEAAIDDVLDTTERLAAEQARYEIQFRADLAELAERLRRPNAQ